MLTTIAAGAIAVQAAHQPVSFSDFGVILEKMPFGRAPQIPVAPVPANPAPTKEERDIYGNMRVCFMDITQDGLRVAIVDNKLNETYQLGIGESDRSLKLLDADYDRELAFVQKDGYGPQWINSQGLSEATAPSAGTRSNRSSRRSSPGARRSVTEQNTRSAELEARLKRREEILQQRREESAANSANPEELRAKLLEYNMDLIRAGGELGPPLPIPLTREQDDQLVAEGVLPPAE